MRILQHNVLDGCQESDRLRKWNSWMKSRPYDVAGFNELNGWNAETWARQTASWGYPHSHVFETRRSRYYVGIAARAPIRIVAEVEEPFHHALLHVVIDKVHYLVTHLSPADSVVREREARYIAELVREIGEPLVLMGDLNTLSPHDADHYARAGLLGLLAQSGALNKKFTKNGELNFEPMRILLDAGLTDLGEREPFAFSVPTAVNRDKMHAAELRLDYVLVNEPLRRLGPAVRIIRDAETDELSDHYPIEWQWPW